MTRPKLVPTHIGDVLILSTKTSYETHAVGVVTTVGQQGFLGDSGVQYIDAEPAAIVAATALAGAVGRIYHVNIDTEEWREIPRQ